MLRLSRLLVCLSAAAAATAANAEFTPRVTAGLIHTDNLALDPVNTESATVLNVRPEFTAMRESPRLTTNATYRLDAYRYKERGETEVYNLFDGILIAALVPDRFFFNLGGSRVQAIVDPESTLPTDNLAISTNRVDRDDYYAGPSFELPTGGNVTINGSVRRNWTRYGDLAVPNAPLGDFLDSQRDDATLGVDNYRKGTGFTWAVGANAEKSDYGEAFVPYEYRQARAELGFWATQAARVFVAGGKESAWDQPLDPSIEDSFWEAGFLRQIGERLTTEFAAGERSFGSSRRGRVQYDFVRGRFDLSYAESPTTTSNNRFSVGGLGDPLDPQDYLLRPGAVERFISEDFRATLTFELRRATVQLGAYDESRSDRAQADGTPLADEKQSSQYASFAWQFGTRTEAFVRRQQIDREFGDGIESDVSSSTIGASYRLGRRTELVFAYDTREQDSEESSELNYEAKIVSLSVARTFRQQ